MSDKLENTIAEFHGSAKILHIETDEKFEQAGVDLQRAKTIQKEIDETFDPIIQKAHAAHKEAITQKKKFSEPLDAAISLVKKVMLAYKKKKDDEARKKQLAEEKKARAAAEKKAEKEAAALEKQGRHEEAAAVESAPVYVAPAVKESAPKVSGVSYKKNWKMRIVNADLVPREWMVIDEKALRSFAKSSKGRIKVPGVEFYTEESMANRV